MQWYENEKQNQNDTKINKLLIVAMCITLAIIVIIIALIMYISKGSTRNIATVDGVQNNQIFKLLDFEKKEDGNTEIWVPIKEFASSLGYEAFNGLYNSATEDKNKCYVIVGKNDENDSGNKEVANFELESDTIAKLDLSSSKSEYEYYQIEDKVIQKDGILYTTIEGIEKGLNLAINYDSNEEQITIYTLDWLVDYYEKAIEQGKYPGCKKLDTESLKNEKAILQNMLVIISENGKYGVINSRKR